MSHSIRNFQEAEMNETTNPPTPQPGRDHARAVIIATTIVALTCVLSCAAVLIVLIMRTAH
jgi:hypothetical protein